MTEFEFEEEEYVCTSCGSENWHANVFFLNRKKRWFNDEEHYIWCADCDGPTDITPLKEYEEEEMMSTEKLATTHLEFGR